jgi:hypothetical protein
LSQDRRLVSFNASSGKSRNSQPGCYHIDAWILIDRSCRIAKMAHDVLPLLTSDNMPKKRAKPGKRSQGKTPRRAQQHAVRHDVPSAQTLFRINLFDRHTYTALRKVPAQLKPILQLRDHERIEQVKRASTPGVLLDLAPQTTGLAETVWEDRMQQLGPEILPLIVERLQQSRTMWDLDAQTRLHEKLIAHLRWCGDAGAEAHDMLPIHSTLISSARILDDL